MAKDDGEMPYPRMLAERFREYVGQLRGVYGGLRLSRLAQELGYADSRFLDLLSEGVEYLGWAEIDDFCARAGVDAAWFKHGEGEPFAPSDACQPDVTALLNELDAGDDWRLYLVRVGLPAGTCLFSSGGTTISSGGCVGHVVAPERGERGRRSA